MPVPHQHSLRCAQAARRVLPFAAVTVCLRPFSRVEDVEQIAVVAQGDGVMREGVAHGLQISHWYSVSVE